MKKILIALVFLIVALPVVSSVEFDLKDNFNQGETLLAVVSGNFLEPPLKENIHLYRGHVRVPFEFDLAHVNSKYYISGNLLGKIPANYSLKIENVRYYEAGKISENDLVKYFTISNKTADFSIKPGFILTSETFSVEIQNLLNKELNISVIPDKEIRGKSSLNLISGETKKIYFSPEQLNRSSFKKIIFSSQGLSYEMPVYILASSYNNSCAQNINCTAYNISGNTSETGNLVFEPSYLNLTIPLNLTTFSYEVYLKNSGNYDSLDINFYISQSIEDYVEIQFNFIDLLEAGSKVRLELQITLPENEKIINGYIKASDSSQSQGFLFLKLNFTNSGRLNVSYNNYSSQNYTKTNSTNTTIPSGDKKSKSTSIGKIIGWSIIILLGLYLMWFFLKRYKRAIPKKPDLKTLSNKKPLLRTP